MNCVAFQEIAAYTAAISLMSGDFMHAPSNTKYGFRIRTRSGAIVDNLLIFGRDAPEAERKLRQMYIGCEILEKRNVASSSSRSGPVNYEDVVDLISGH